MINLNEGGPNWSVGMKLKRGLWTFLVEPIGRWLPKYFSPFRILLLRLFGAQIGRNCLVLPGVKVLMPWNLILEEFVAIGESVNLYNFAAIRVGRMTIVSQNCFICTGSHDYNHINMPLIYSEITIGSECWIAADAFVSPGVTIADGVVVGARSVVTKSLPKAWSVYAGNPSVYIKPRVVGSN